MTYKPTGIFHLTGEIDTGKTSVGLSAYPLKDTAYIYEDVKKFSIEGMDAKKAEKEFGLFLNLTEKYPVQKFKELEFAKKVMEEIDKIEKDKYQAIVFDTWTRFGKALRRYAKANPLLFREKEAFTNQVAIRHAEEWGQAGIVEKNYIATLAQKSEALFLITHLKSKRKGGIETEAFEPDCGKALNTVCNMRLWLRLNPNSGVPIALVLKRLSKVSIVDGIIKPVNLLPRKIMPLPEEESVWDCINRYWEEPMGNRKPSENEKPNEFELSILDGVLTKGQKEVWQAELRAQQQMEKEAEVFFNSQFDEAKTLAIKLASAYEGLPLPIVAGKILLDLQKEYPDFEIDDVKEMLK